MRKGVPRGVLFPGYADLGMEIPLEFEHLQSVRLRLV